MIFNRVSDSSVDASSGATLSIDPTDPVHGLYAAAAVTAGATIVGCVGVTTIAAPGLVLVPGCAAAAMAAGAAVINNNRTDQRSIDETGNNAPAAAGA